MKVTQQTPDAKPKINLTDTLPSRRYIISGDIAAMPNELARRKIPEDVLDAHAMDVSETLDGMASSAKRLAGRGLDFEEVLFGAARVSQEVLDASD
ncbi:MAG: hypothetical protein ABH834_07920 [Candidatus Altiarchaeota archaeon]